MAALRLLCVAAACQACLGIRRWPEFRVPVRTPKPEPSPAFYACNGVGAEVAGGCPKAGPQPSRTMESLLKNGYSRLQTIEKNGRNPLIMFIGAGALQSGERWSDSYFFKKILQDGNLTRQFVKAAFVDPLEEVPEFKQKVYISRLNTSYVSHVHGVLDPHCAGQTQLYRFSPKAVSDSGLDASASVARLFSTRREQPVAIARSWVNGNTTCQPMPECKEGAEKMGKDADMTKLVEEVRVPCMAPLDMIRDTENAIHNIGAMFVNTEGMSMQSLYQLMMHSDFEPGFVMWKSTGAPEEVELRRHFRKHGYEVGVKPAGDGTAPGHYIAVRAPKTGFGAAR